MHARNSLKRRAKDSFDIATQIIQKCKAKVFTERPLYFPTVDAMRMIIDLWLLQCNQRMLPENVEPFQIGIHKQEINNFYWDLGHYSHNDEAVIVFATKQKTFCICHHSEYTWWDVWMDLVLQLHSTHERIGLKSDLAPSIWITVLKNLNFFWRSKK